MAGGREHPWAPKGRRRKLRAGSGSERGAGYGGRMLTTLLVLLACGNAPSAPAAPAPTTAVPTTAPATAPTTAPATTTAAPAGSIPASAMLRVVFLGDSLTAGLGLGEAEAFPALLGERFGRAGLPVKVVNAGVSGDTTAGGLRRVEWVLGQKPDVVVVGLGGNDMLRGLPPEDTEANLRGILVRCRDAGAATVLLGMRANPTLGPDYAARFDPLYERLATELKVPLVPFLLEGVAGVAELNQADGIHPTAEGHRRVAELVAPTLEAVVRERLAAR